MSQRIEQPAEQGPATPAPVARIAKVAAEFGEDNTRFLWGPYFPVGDYTVMMAEGGTGKTMLCCKIAAAVSAGTALPGAAAEQESRNVLIVSAEDSGEVLRKRLSASGADLQRVYILDRETSAGLNLAEGYDEFLATVQSYNPALVIVDPWHAYLGPIININKANALRPILQGVANLAKKCSCAIILVSHINKATQGENANNAATGSVDFINAARSAVRIIFNDEDRSERIMVHTKSNYAEYGPSIKYYINDEGGVEWDGFSDVTRQTLEAASRRRSTPAEILQHERQQYHDDPVVRTIKALLEQSTDAEWEGTMGDLLVAGETILHQQLAKTPRSLAAAVGRLDNQLHADGIDHTRVPHGTGGGRHRFRLRLLADIDTEPGLLNIKF